MIDRPAILYKLKCGAYENLSDRKKDISRALILGLRETSAHGDVEHRVAMSLQLWESQLTAWTVYHARLSEQLTPTPAML